MKEGIKQIIKGTIICISFLVVVLLIFNYFHNKRLDRFKNEPNCLTKTTKIGFSRDGDGTDWVDFEFINDNKTYEGSHSLGEGEKMKIKDTMTVRYLCNEPEQNMLIIE